MGSADARRASLKEALMVLIASLLIISLAMSTTFVRRLLPFESFVAVGAIATTLFVLLQFGRLG